ncbi:phage tail protein [Massilia antarctica]|uniref:phage tail protein n=1 Tax=Massilia antarctica TaxID=2765360 RepID=UPI0006BB7EA0|nr:phage tail protein [Massilia sp. H27-R4]MCY0911126.1 phage tail protein [Massilia sp. H27-R4]CUI05290.1 probable phage protein YPO2116 [Janthinobacterium sp. CG23_2]CUU29076.1 probable phage protein YPO2116 [Janthinobacterium sp. CG23_2]
MAVSLPNGIVLALATAYAAPIAVTAATNGSEAVLTVANALVAGDYVEFSSGWSRANGRVFRVKAPTTTTIVAEALDTTSTSLFPIGSGVGTIRKINSWTQITQIMGCTSSGGEPQYQTYSFLEQDFDSQIPTTTSAQSLALEIADDPSLAGYQALKNASQGRNPTALRATLPAGGFILYNGVFAFDETPSLTKGSLMAVKAGMALQGRPVRYIA